MQSCESGSYKPEPVGRNCKALGSCPAPTNTRTHTVLWDLSGSQLQTEMGCISKGQNIHAADEIR